MDIVVYKLGGSLLEISDLPQLLAQVLNGRPQHHPLLVVGGGAIANAVRTWDAVHALGEEKSHWLTLQSLVATETLLVNLLPRAQIVENLVGFVAARQEQRVPVLSSVRFLQDDEDRPPPHLPHSWDVTSDSIAAWVASRWQAAELVLIKSVSLPASCKVADARQSNLVDSYFDRAAAGLPRVSWVNLRESPRIVPWLGQLGTM